MRILGEDFSDTTKADWKRLIALLQLSHIQGERVLENQHSVQEGEVYLIEFRNHYAEWMSGKGERGRWFGVCLVYLQSEPLNHKYTFYFIDVDGRKKILMDFEYYNIWGPLTAQQLLYIQAFGKTVPQEKAHRELLREAIKRDIKKILAEPIPAGR